MISNVQLKKQKQLMFLNWHINIGYIDLEVIYCVHMPQNQTWWWSHPRTSCNVDEGGTYDVLHIMLNVWNSKMYTNACTLRCWLCTPLCPPPSWQEHKVNA